MTNLPNRLRLILMLLLSLTALSAGAEETGKECHYEVKLWGKLKSGPNAIDQDHLRVSVVGEMRSGQSVWYSVVRRPGAEPDLIPQFALEQPYPSGTCLSWVASLKDSVQEAWSQYTSDMIHEDDVEIPVPAVRKPVNKELARQNLAFSGGTEGAK